MESKGARRAGYQAPCSFSIGMGSLRLTMGGIYKRIGLRSETPRRRQLSETLPGLTITWAQRLNRVFRVDIETCRHCGGAVLQIHRESGHSISGFQGRRMSEVGRFPPFRLSFPPQGAQRRLATQRRRSTNPLFPSPKLFIMGNGEAKSTKIAD